MIVSGDRGKLQWTGNWVTFLDTMLQMMVLGLSGRSLRLPTRIRSVCVDPTAHGEKVWAYADGQEGTCVYSCGVKQSRVVCCPISGLRLRPAAATVHVDRCLDRICAGGVQISGLHATVAPRRQQQQSPPTLEEFVFVPYVEDRCLAADEKLSKQLRVCKGTKGLCHVTRRLSAVPS